MKEHFFGAQISSEFDDTQFEIHLFSTVFQLKMEHFFLFSFCVSAHFEHS